jgi:predicted DNA binding CopG/RHH family protein
MYRDEKGRWFCPECILEDLDQAFLDENLTDPGDLEKPFVMQPPTKPVSIRIAIPDLERAKALAQKKGIPKYQTYLKTLLHEALIKEERGMYAPNRRKASRRNRPS